jgi:hypothetical protein
MTLPVPKGAFDNLLAAEYNNLIALLTPLAWQPITLTGSWTNRPGYTVASYRKLFSGSNLQIVLNLSAGTLTNGTTIFTLPVGYRPISIVQMSIITRISAAPQQMGAIEIDTAGAAKIYDVGATTILHANGSIPLDL